MLKVKKALIRVHDAIAMVIPEDEAFFGLKAMHDHLARKNGAGSRRMKRAEMTKPDKPIGSTPGFEAAFHVEQCSTITFSRSDGREGSVSSIENAL